jgi:peptidoglycan/xylan/chitin deacetylase (PgdA/CDA1 family)
MKLPNTIINFHVIQNAQWMEDILKVLKRRYKMVSAKDLENFYYQGQDLQHACHITVDDGDVSVYSHLFPLIQKYQVPISIYVSPRAVMTGENFWFQEIKGYDLQSLLKVYNRIYGEKHVFTGKNQVIGLIKSLPLKEIKGLLAAFKSEFGIPDKPRRSMNLEQLKELKASGLVDIGAHTMQHPILKNESFETAKDEIQQSVLQLNQILDQETRLFAYPNGVPVIDFGEREMNVLQDCGIKLAFSTEARKFSTQDHPLSIPRRGITKGGPLFVLAKLALGDKWEEMKRLIKGKQEPDFRVGGSQ